MNLLLALFLILTEACFEGLRTAGYYLASEIVELVYLTGITFGLFAWLNWKQINSFFDREKLIVVLIGYVLLRFALFDSAWNLAAGQDFFYYGATKLYDRIMIQLGSWGWMLKGIAGLWGIAWLMDWRNGIKKVR